jgi:nucleolar protein 53
MVSTEQILNKRKRVSKKNKKSWRKHTEINDVEKFLEAKLREERTG